MTIPEYIAELRKNLAHGDATEHTHRPVLKSLLESLGKNIIATNEPKRIDCGAPDFIITRKNVPLGHVETKDVGTLLGDIEKGKGPHGEQFKRYRDGLPNWILTDYLEFHWYVAGERRPLTAQLGTYDSKKKKIQIRAEGEDELDRLLEAFFKQPALTVESAKDLAGRMAGMTKVVRDLIIGTFKHGSTKDKKQLENWITSFREVLIPDLDEPQFADMFAQTLAYGLFAARVHSLTSGKPFSREVAAFNLPRTNPFLRKLFAEIAGVDMPETFGWAVDDLVSLLNHADWDKVLKDFGKGQAKHDPVVHFYETFLNAYDPKMREIRGVYYTPEPVVSYIVRSLDHLLKTRFRRPKGLADKDTLILDPAVGTATFLFSTIQEIYKHFQNQQGAWDGYVTDYLLNRVFGFELLMAPYAVAHLKLGMELQETGYHFSSEQRLGIYLTNTLEEAARKGEQLFAQFISDEANAAAALKRERPILVVLGNPPYSGHSANRNRDESGKLTFIGELMESYKEGCPELHKPAQAKWLQDDYVKFIRFAQWRIDRTGEGLIGYITNHSYLDNPTFRGMRRKLMKSFEEIYIYDLHGNSKKKEQAPNGRKDENVFDIQQGVAILLCVKYIEKHLDLKWLEDGAGDLTRTIGPRDVLDYVYAVLNSPAYRERYADFLKRDFPRVPLSRERTILRALCKRGHQLIALHLLEPSEQEELVTDFPERGDNAVEKAIFTGNNNRVWINANQYFGGVPQTVWEFQIGGYQVCQKWLKDRKGRKLTYNDIQHWQRIVVAISGTMRLTKEIDNLIPGWPLP